MESTVIAAFTWSDGPVEPDADAIAMSQTTVPIMRAFVN